MNTDQTQADAEQGLGQQATFVSMVPWLVTVAFLLVFAFGVLTSNALGGVAEGALVASAAMAMVSLVLGRRDIS